MPLSWKWC